MKIKLFLLVMLIMLSISLFSQEGYWKVSDTNILGAKGVVEYQHWVSDNTIVCLNYGAGNRVTLTYSAWFTSPYLPGKVTVGYVEYLIKLGTEGMVLMTEMNEYVYTPPTIIAYEKCSEAEAKAFDADYLAITTSKNTTVQPTATAKSMSSPDYIKSQIRYYQDKIDETQKRITMYEGFPEKQKTATTYMLINQLYSEKASYEKYKSDWEAKLY